MRPEDGVLSTITPSTAATCMYFWTILRSYRLRDQTLTTQLRKANAKIFEEDRAALEAQQLSITAQPTVPLRNLNIDAGSLWSRRIIDRTIESESGADIALSRR